MAIKVRFLVSRDLPNLRSFSKEEVVELDDDIAIVLERQGFVEIKKDKHKKKNIVHENEITNIEIGG